VRDSLRALSKLRGRKPTPPTGLTVLSRTLKKGDFERTSTPLFKGSQCVGRVKRLEASGVGRGDLQGLKTLPSPGCISTSRHKKYGVLSKLKFANQDKSSPIKWVGIFFHCRQHGLTQCTGFIRLTLDVAIEFSHQ
jgi:hypothetical protein